LKSTAFSPIFFLGHKLGLDNYDFRAQNYGQIKTDTQMAFPKKPIINTFVILQMAKWCTRAVYEHSISASNSLLSTVRLYLEMYFMLTKICLYEYYLAYAKIT
jgi:hypothetical protein